MNIDSKEIQMIKLNKYAREYIEEKNNNINYEKISKQMKEFSGAEYVMFNIFDENGKDFILVGFEGNKNKINKVMDIIGYNIVGKKFKYEEGRNERFEKSIVTRIESLNELVGNALPKSMALLIEKVFKIDYIKTVRITKDEKTIGNFTLIYSENENKNDDEMLKLFASQVGLFIDKKKDELKTIEMKERLENIIKGTNVGTWELNVKTGESIVNKRWAEMLGYKLEEILPASREKRESLIHPDDLGKLQREFQKALNKEIEYYDIELRKRHKNGNWIWINARAKVTKWSEDGSPLVVSGALTDITEKIKYENKIINQRDYLFKIFNSMSQYVIVTGLDYKIQFMNEKAIRDFGNIKGKICFKQLGREIPCEECRLHEIEKIKDNESIKYTIKAHNKDLEINASRIENLDGSFSIVEIIEDITEKKKSKQKIIEMNERLENIIKGTNVGTWEWNLETGETIFDNKWAEMLGYTLEEISPVNIQTWEKLTHPDDFKRAGKELEKVMNKELEYYDFELRMKHKNGEWIWIHDRGRVTKWSDDGKALFISGTHMDISDRKKIEERLKENQIRLELAMDAGEHGFWDWNLTTDITYFSPTYYTMLGYEDKELPMNFDTFNQLIHPDDATKVMHKTKNFSWKSL